MQRAHRAYPAFWSVFRQFDNEESRSELLDFYLKMEQAATKQFEKGNLKEGDSITIPAEGFFTLRFEFFKKETALYMKRPNEEELCVISKTDSANKEYRFLQGIEETCKASVFCILD